MGSADRRAVALAKPGRADRIRAFGERLYRRYETARVRNAASAALCRAAEAWAEFATKHEPAAMAISGKPREELRASCDAIVWRPLTWEEREALAQLRGPGDRGDAGLRAREERAAS